MATALVVDDEVDLCRLMQITLTKMGIQSDIAYTLETAKNYLAQKTYDFCLTDLKLPDGSGLDLVRLVNGSSSTPIAVITAHGSMDLAIEALKLGAFDFVNKPLELPRLRLLVENALKVGAESQTPSDMQISPEDALLNERLIGHSPAMQQLKNTIKKLARSQAPVFLWGASGTGKEVVARLIHDLSPRRDGSFVPVNCGAIPSELMESEFFGHKKGSFTGATADKQGLFQQANGGTLFLDEVADLPLAMQVKLLRAIQEKTVRAIGDTKEVPVDVRILSATHKDLNHLVQVGAFRQDLFYRINVIELKLPTLNQRREDIPKLAEHFLQLIAKDWQLDIPPVLSPEAKQKLQQHDFEGNVRELRNLLERAVTMAESHIIEANHLGTISQPSVQNDTGFNKASAYEEDTRSTLDKVSFANNQPHPQHNTEKAPPAQEPTQPIPAKVSPYQANSMYSATLISGLNDPIYKLNADNRVDNRTDKADPKIDKDNSPTQSLPEEGLEAYLQEQEKQFIITALNKTNWNKTKAAKLLGMSFRSLRYRMDKLGIGDGDDDN